MDTLPINGVLIQPCDKCHKAREALDQAKQALSGHGKLYNTLPPGVECFHCFGIGWTLTKAGELVADILLSRVRRGIKAAREEEMPF